MKNREIVCCYWLGMVSNNNDRNEYEGEDSGVYFVLFIIFGIYLD